MTAMTNHWLFIDEPTGDGRVRATLMQTYNDNTKDKTQYGTVGYEALEMMENDSEIIEARHEDNSIDLSYLSDEKEDKLLKTWEEGQY